MKKLFYLLTALFMFVSLSVDAQSKVYTKGGVFYITDTQTNVQYEGIANDVLVLRSLTSSTDFYFRNVNGWEDAKFLNITDIQDESGTNYTLSTFVSFYENLTLASENNNEEYYLKVKKGLIPGESIVTKFGRNASVGTTLSHISISGSYETPSTAQSLEMLSSDVDDTSAGLGARKVVVEGLDASWNVQHDTIVMNGTTAVALSKQFTRIYRGKVIESGTYATTTTSSQQGQITLRGSGAGVTWLIIDTVEGTASGTGIGQSQVGSFSIPIGYSAFLLSKTVSVESSKPASVYFFKREKIDDVVAPFTGVMQLFEQNDGIETVFSLSGKAPLNHFQGPSDVGFFAKVGTGTASVSVEFQLLLVKD